MEGLAKGVEMMDDLISRAAAIDAVYYKPSYKMTIEVLKEVPAVDAVPVVHGRWERVGSDGIVCCSVCGMPLKRTRVCWPDGGSEYYYIASNYCPNCGARNEKGDCDG